MASHGLIAEGNGKGIFIQHRTNFKREVVLNQKCLKQDFTKVSQIDFYQTHRTLRIDLLITNFSIGSFHTLLLSQLSDGKHSTMAGHVLVAGGNKWTDCRRQWKGGN